MILLTEQTRDWENGRPEVVLAGIRRYTIGAAAIAVVALGPALLAMRWAVRIVLGAQYLPAVSAARLILVAAAIQMVLSWTKTFPVTIGRPGLRLWAHGVETAVLLPLIVVFGKAWGVTGAGAAVLASSGAFAVAWAVIYVRLRRSGMLTPG
jgi:O-antigen/teichoic acid export membrane protein